MSAYSFRAAHLKLVGLYYARHNIRGGTGILFTLILLIAGLGIAAAFISPLEQIYKRAVEQRKAIEAQQGIKGVPAVTKKAIVDQVTKDIGEPVAKWATDDSEQARFLTQDKPAVVSAILMVLMFAMPFLVCVGSFNQFSGDIQSKGLRYLLLRTERANLFFGRFLGTLVFTLVMLAVLLLVVFLYLAFKANFYAPGEVALWLLQGYVALVLFSVPYIALCSWISASIDSPFVSLVICELVIVVVPAFVAIGSGIETNIQYLGYITPWPLKYQLLHPNPLHFLAATLAMIGFTGLFLWVGMRTFQSRDL